MLRERQQTEALDVRQALTEWLRALGLNLSPEQIEKLYSHYSLLLTWNEKINLTSIRDPLLIVRRHFLDSGAIVRFLSPVGRFLDVGSGAGFPGIPVKVLLPEKEMFLIESYRKKANFPREVIRQLDLKKATVLEKRLEAASPQETGSFDEVITRAFGSFGIFLKLSFLFLRPGGTSIIMHGPKGKEIFSALKDKAREIGFARGRIETYLLPFGKEQRTALIFSKS